MRRENRRIPGRYAAGVIERLGRRRLARELRRGPSLRRAVQSSAHHQGVFAGRVDVVIHSSHHRVIVHHVGGIKQQIVEIQTFVGRSQWVVALRVLLHQTHYVGVLSLVKGVDGGHVRWTELDYLAAFLLHLDDALPEGSAWNRGCLGGGASVLPALVIEEEEYLP